MGLGSEATRLAEMLGTAVRRGLLSALTRYNTLVLQRRQEALKHSATARARAEGRRPLSLELAALKERVSDASLPAEHRSVNQGSLAKLTGFVDSLRHPTKYPQKQILKFDFWIRQADAIVPARGMVRTTGGDCAALVEEGLGSLLGRAGLSPAVYFDGGEFEAARHSITEAHHLRRVRKAYDSLADTNPPDSAREEEFWNDVLERDGSSAAAADSTSAASHSDRPTAESLEAVSRARSAAAALGFSSQLMTAEQIEALGSKTGKGAGLSSRPPEKEDLEAGTEWAEKLQHLDPLLKLLAALPFLKDLEDQRAVYIRTKVIDALEEHNWDIRGAVHRLWAGERKVEVLTRGKGAHTAAIIEIMLKNTQENDAKYGYKTYLAPKA